MKIILYNPNPFVNSMVFLSIHPIMKDCSKNNNFTSGHFGLYEFNSTPSTPVKPHPPSTTTKATPTFKCHSWCDKWQWPITEQASKFISSSPVWIPHSMTILLQSQETSAAWHQNDLQTNKRDSTPNLNNEKWKYLFDTCIYRTVE